MTRFFNKEKGAETLPDVASYSRVSLYRPGHSDREMKTRSASSGVAVGPSVDAPEHRLITPNRSNLPREMMARMC